MRRKNKFNHHMTRIILLISFIFLFGRFVYSAIGAWYHHQEKVEAQQSCQPVDNSGR